MQLVTKRDMEDAEALGALLAMNEDAGWEDVRHEIAQAIANGRRATGGND